MDTRLYVIRHAESVGNVNGRFCGWTDLPLTEKGKVQAKALSRFLKDKNIDSVYSSTLKRAMQTCNIALPEYDDEIILSDDLKEINGGSWEMTRWEELPVKWPKEYTVMKMPGGESVQQLYERTSLFIDQVIRDNMGKSIGIFTHGTVIKALIAYLVHKDINYLNNIIWHENASVTLFKITDESVRMVYEGESSFIHDDISTVRNAKWNKKRG